MLVVEVFVSGLSPRKKVVRLLMLLLLAATARPSLIEAVLERKAWDVPLVDEECPSPVAFVAFEN